MGEIWGAETFYLTYSPIENVIRIPSQDLPDAAKEQLDLSNALPILYLFMCSQIMPESGSSNIPLKAYKEIAIMLREEAKEGIENWDIEHFLNPQNTLPNTDFTTQQLHLAIAFAAINAYHPEFVSLVEVARIRPILAKYRILFSAPKKGNNMCRSHLGHSLM